MAWVRKLPSGLHSATVRTPAGRITESFDLLSQANGWARDQEAAIRRGDWIDPRRAKILTGAWWEQCQGARHLAQASRLRDASHWRCHVEPRWGETAIGAITKSDVGKWIVAMSEAGVGAATIEGAVGVLRALLDQAIEEEILRVNAARRVRKPPRDAHVDRVLDYGEEKQLLDALDRLFPDRADARLFCELVVDTGMRWEEAAVLPPSLVDTRRQRIHIAWVMERDGTARPYAKSTAGNRMVTYGDALVDRVAAAKRAARAVAGVFPRGGPAEMVFTSPTGRVLSYSNWHHRVWSVALAGRPAIGKVRGHKPREAVPGAGLDDPQPTCHDLRHTFGTRLADAGVPVHDLMALLGHGDVRSTQRYMHSTEARFERAREALKRARSAG